MRILYDGAIYSVQNSGGINNYFANIINRLPLEFLPILTTTSIKDVNYPINPNLKTYYYKRFGFRPGRLSYWIEKYYFQLIHKIQRADIIHPTYYYLLTRNNLNHDARVVITLHDLIHEKFYPEDELVIHKNKMIERADAIICVSNNTKNDLLNSYSVDETKVSLIYLASNISKSDVLCNSKVPESPYYLYVGNRYSYKNFNLLLKTFSRVISSQPKLRLCVVGPGFSNEELSIISNLRIRENIDYYGFVDDAHLAKLYYYSIALVYPSEYEGFGIPPLEAMACGTVPVVSNTSSLPEVVGNAGIIFDLKAESDLIDILISLYKDPEQRHELIERGFERAKQFDWNKTVSSTIDVYESLLQ